MVIGYQDGGLIIHYMYYGWSYIQLMFPMQCCVVTDEPQLMITAGPSMVYGAAPGMYGAYPGAMPGYAMPQM